MSCMKRVWRRLFGNKPMRILLLGLDAAGKTTILYQLMGKGGDTVPTIGFNVETIKVPPLEFLVWDVSGQERLRTFWRHYYHGTTGIVFVVDSHDVERLPIAKRELHGILKEEELNEAVLLIIANKTDLPNAVSAERLSQELDLPSLQGRVMHIQPAVAQKGTGLKEGLVWLAKAMKAHSKQQARMQQSAGSGAQQYAVQPTSSYPTFSSTPGQPQPARNWDNPYDEQTAGHTGSTNTTQQQQPRQQPAVAAASSGSLHSTTSTTVAPAASMAPVTAAAASSSSAASAASTASLPPSSAAPLAAVSVQPNSFQPIVELRPSAGTDEQPGPSSHIQSAPGVTASTTEVAVGGSPAPSLQSSAGGPSLPLVADGSAAASSSALQQ